MLVDQVDAILGVIKKYLRDNVYAPIPGVVVNVDDYEEKQTVDVRIAIPRIYLDGHVVPESSNTIHGCPFINPGAGGGVDTYPVKVGDPVLLVFGMRDTDNWKLSDGSDELPPASSRYCNISDAIAIPGLSTIHTHLNPHPDNAEKKFGDCLLSMRPNGDIVLTNSKGTLELLNDETIRLSNSSASYTINPDGSTVETNGSGTKTLASSGVFNINGFIINTDGSVSSPVSVTAPTINGTSSVLAAGDEVVNHVHGGVDPGTSNTGPL